MQGPVHRVQLQCCWCWKAGGPWSSGSGMQDEDQHEVQKLWVQSRSVHTHGVLAQRPITGVWGSLKLQVWACSHRECMGF